jgi:hypothetical protein
LAQALNAGKKRNNASSLISVSIPRNCGPFPHPK